MKLQPFFAPKPFRIARCVLLALLVVAGTDSGLAEAPESIAVGKNRFLIRADHVHLGNGDVMSPGMVLVVDGKIIGVGETIELAGPAREVKVDTVMPGLVNAASSAGIVDGGGESSREVTPDFDTLGLVDWSSRDFKEALDGGETTLHVMPSTDNVISGWTTLIKTTASEQDSVMVPRRGVGLSVCSDPTGRNRSRTRPDSIYVRQPTNRMGVVWILRNQMHRAAQQKKESADRPDADANSQTAPLQGVLAGNVPAFGVSRTAFDIQTLLRIADEFDFQPIVVGGHEAYNVIDLLKQKQSSVVYTAAVPSIFGEERTELFWATPVRLRDADIPFCVAGDNLLVRMRMAVRFGLEPAQAVTAVTSSPAKLLGIDDRVGEIRTGLDADLVGMSGPPHQMTSSVSWVMVDGKLALENP